MRESIYTTCWKLVVAVVLTLSPGSVAFAGGSSVPRPVWAHSWGTNAEDLARNAVVNGSGEVYLTGTAGTNVLLLKYDHDGQLLWAKNWDLGARERGLGITLAENGDVIIAGSSRFGGYADDMLLLRVDDTGTVIWSRSWSNAWDIAENVRLASDGSGDMYVCGASGPGASDQDAMLFKYDQNGNLLWKRAWSRGAHEGGRGLAVDNEGYVYMTGETGCCAGSGAQDVFLTKFDPDGNQIWGRVWSLAGDDRPYGMTIGGDGSLYIVGPTASSGAGARDIFVLKFDTDGNLVWDRTWGGPGDDVGWSVAVSQDGCINVVGWTGNFGAGGRDLVLLRYDAAGNILTEQVWGTLGDERGLCVVAGESPDIFISGNSASAAGAWQDIGGTVGIPGGSITDAGAAVIVPAGTESTIIPHETSSSAVVDLGGGGRDALLLALSLEPPKGSVTGTVTADCPAPNEGLLGVKVDAFEQGTGDLVGSAVTDANGEYQIDDVPAGDNTITIVTPLSYSATVEEIVVTVPGGGVVTADFALTCTNITAEPRTIGFWKHQVGVATSGKGKAQIDAATLCSYLDRTEAHFNSNAINAVVVYVPPGTGVCTDKLSVAKSLLNLKGNVGMTARARQQLMALLLNVASGKIGLTEIISADGATVSQTITYADNLIDDPAGDHETAKTVCDEINNNRRVASGVIPLTTPDIAYRLIPEGFSLQQNYPNPFNAGTVISYALEGNGLAKLEIFDVLGRSVTTLVNEARTAGLHRTAWNGTDRTGRTVSSGLYFYRLTVGDVAVTKKMVLLK